MAPVILRTEVHCLGCARKIRRAVKSLYGVEKVWASPDTGLVVVAGAADARVLKWRIESKMRREVTIVSDGAEDQPLQWQPQQALPPPPPPPPPLGYPYYSSRMVQAVPRSYAAAPAPAYVYAPRYVATRPQISEPQVCFQNDNPPNGCCVQ